MAASLSLAGAVGCDGSVAQPVHVPRVATKVVVVETGESMCGADDDEPEQWLPDDRCVVVHRPVDYVKMSEWTAPPSVQELEAAVPPRGDAPPSYIEFPTLTKHAGIGGRMHFRRH